MEGFSLFFATRRFIHFARNNLTIFTDTFLHLREFVDTIRETASPPIAQLDRAPGFEPGCREFESLWAGQLLYVLHTKQL